MDNKEQEDIPPEALVAFCLEEAKAAFIEKRPISENVLKFNRFLRRMLTDFLSELDGKLTDQEFEKASESIYSVVTYEAKLVNFLGHSLLELKRKYKERPSQLSVPMSFNDKVKDYCQAKKIQKSHEMDFGTAFAKISQEPIAGTFKQLNFLIWEQRLLRRYLRARFGMKQRLLHRQIFKQTRLAKWQRQFQNWRRQKGKTGRVYSTPEIEADIQSWRHELLVERGLLHYASETLVSAQTQQVIWEGNIFLSFTSLHQKHGGGGFSWEEFSSDVLQRMKPILRDFYLIMQTTSIRVKQQLSLDYEKELVALTAWTASNVNLSLNRGVRKALKAEGKPFLEAKLEQIPGNILIALAEGLPEGGFSSGDGLDRILNRVTSLIRDEMPLDARHEALRQDRLRKAAKKELADTTFEGNVASSVLKPEELAERHAQDFILREEVRIDLDRHIKRANLSELELRVLELKLQDLTENEIAGSLNRKVGTVKSAWSRVREKLSDAIPRS